MRVENHRALMMTGRVEMPLKPIPIMPFPNHPIIDRPLPHHNPFDLGDDDEDE